MSLLNTSFLSRIVVGVCDLPNCVSRFEVGSVRWASKKTSGSTQNRTRNSQPKHRGVKVFDGQYVPAGKMLAKQYHLRYYPGLHVGFGKNGTLFAREAGKVIISTEKVNPDPINVWVRKKLEGRDTQNMYRKFFNIIPEKQIGRFRLIDEI